MALSEPVKLDSKDKYTNSYCISAKPLLQATWLCKNLAPSPFSSRVARQHNRIWKVANLHTILGMSIHSLGFRVC